ncbi:unnamed protein product [Sphenostylis stenocarpa]|uniref:Uncharacterized protein n=1 Tax=Sphenostylis stenocarpa TaxID=92480 RepID=A0AA86SA02_9FABA|nr:unnamed protein product [Sphenostylis stenocarpa]
MVLEILNIFVERKGLYSDPDMLSCMGWTTMCTGQALTLAPERWDMRLGKHLLVGVNKYGAKEYRKLIQ